MQVKAQHLDAKAQAPAPVQPQLLAPPLQLHPLPVLSADQVTGQTTSPLLLTMALHFITDVRIVAWCALLHAGRGYDNVPGFAYFWHHDEWRDDEHCNGPHTPGKSTR